jgi:FkbM family methyltransferase
VLEYGTALEGAKGSNLSVLKPWHHPVRLVRKAIGRLQRKLVRIPDQPVIHTLNGNVRYEHKRLTFLDEEDFRAMLTQSYDITLCDYLRKHLAAGDIVLDAGANVGYISALAVSFVGTTGEVHGFEPLQECFARLMRLKELNPLFTLEFNNIALGEKDGVLPIAFNPVGDSRNATLVPGTQSEGARQVPVRRLDEYIATTISSPARIKLIKIDVEGFEYTLLKGLEGFLSRFQPRIVCEIKPWELKKLGATIEDFDNYMKKFGYRACLIGDENKPIDLRQMTEMDTVVFSA